MSVLSAIAGCQSAVATPLPEFALASTAERPFDPPRLTSEQEQDIRWLESILSNPASDASIRSGAAVRLLNLRVPQATAVLDQALRSGSPSVMLAVVEAMQNAEHPVQGLLEPAVAALRTAQPSLLNPLSVALARYNDGALEQVAELASDRAAETQERLGPIHALGAFRSKAAAVKLMAMLDPQRDENEPIIHAVCDALRRGTGLPYGRDAAQWRAWWDHARHQPREEWMSQMVQRLSEQLAEANQRIVHERERAQSTERRLAEAYRSLFASLSFEEQTAALPALLTDPLESVRGFALDRVSRLLRDSVRIGDDLQHQIAERLNDPAASVRLQSVRLLDQLNYEHAAARAAARLQDEVEPDVMGALLDLLAKRPSETGARAALGLLEHAAFGDRAANVIWEVSLLGYQLDDHLPIVVQKSREVLSTDPSPAHARLLARYGSNGDASDMQHLLDSGSDSMRRRVAEGLFHRGSHQALLDRAHDAVIYPFAVRSLSNGDADLLSFRMLVALHPPADGVVPIWNEALDRLAARLPHHQLAEADDLLASADAPQPLRERILTRAVEDPTEEMTADQRNELVIRLARLLLEQRHAVEAHDLLSNLNDVVHSPSVVHLRFEAAAFAGEFHIAADIIADPEPWVQLLARAETADPTAALAIHNEIIRRFGETLGSELKSEVDAVHRRLQSLEAHIESPA